MEVKQQRCGSSSYTPVGIRVYFSFATHDMLWSGLNHPWNARFQLRIVILQSCRLISWKPTSEKLRCVYSAGNDAARQWETIVSNGAVLLCGWLPCNTLCFNTVWLGNEGERSAWLGPQDCRTLPAFCSLALVYFCLSAGFIFHAALYLWPVAEASFLSLKSKCKSHLIRN